MDTNTIEPMLLAATPTAELDRFAEVDLAIAGLSSVLKELKRRRDEVFIERIRESGEFTLGTVRYYLGDKKKTECLSLAKAIQAIAIVTEGDEDRLIGCFCSDPLKHGTVKKLFEEFAHPETGLVRNVGTIADELYAQLFRTTYEPELKEGKPVKRLMSADSRFVPSRTLRPASTPTEREQVAHAMANVPERFDGGPL